MNFTTKRFLTVARKPGTSDTPVVNISGKWLEEQGFKIGDIVQLEVCPEFITITKTTNQWATEVKTTNSRVMMDAEGYRLNCKRPGTTRKK